MKSSTNSHTFECASVRKATDIQALYFLKTFLNSIFRYNVINFNKSFIHAKLAVGPHVGKENSDIMIPRIKFMPEDQKIPFEWQRIQFPVRVCFGITANR